MPALHLLILQGPGQQERLQAAILGRNWNLLINTSAEAVRETWPDEADAWFRTSTVEVVQSPLAASKAAATGADAWHDHEIAAKHVHGDLRADEQRPGRFGLIVQSGDVAVALSPSPLHLDAFEGARRVVVLDASWTHIPRFPEREQVCEAFEESFRLAPGRVFFVTDLQWDADLFESTATEIGYEDRARVVRVDRFDPAGDQHPSRALEWQVRDVVQDVTTDDAVLIGIVPARDDRGMLQRVRSDFAERTEHVRAYPVYPLSTGPGLSRAEALEAIGLWLPTQVLIAGGPVSEQVMLERTLAEATDGGTATIGGIGAEYRLPSLNLARQYDLETPTPPDVQARRWAARSGMVVATWGPNGTVLLAGAGLSKLARDTMEGLKINRRDRTAEQIVRQIENNFSSRGIPPPFVRFIP